MASNFRITSRRKGDCLHLKLSGDFDGMSAMELIYALKEHNGTARTIYVETDGISSLLPFGRDVFQKHFCFPDNVSRKLFFVGDSGREIAPSGVSCLAGEKCA
jgi:hypothetical protein